MNNDKICPFCGSNENKCMQSRAKEYYVVCFKCFTSGPTKPTVDDAIAAWNTRVELLGNSEELPPRIVREIMKKRSDYSQYIHYELVFREALEWVLSLKREDKE